MKSLGSSVALALSLFVTPLFAEAVKDREGAVRQDKATMENDPRWMYNDVRSGFAQAKRTGKPLLVVLRCVPCLSCAGIDAGVLNDAALVPLLDQFICVRVINANALDLSLFQFDYDLSFTTMFFNGDGTVYGRFGSWTHQKNALDKDTASYRKALEGALAIHRGYPANRAALAGKQGGPTPFKTPVEMPTLVGRYSLDLNWSGKVVPSCVHCHQIGDATRLHYREQKKPLPTELIFSFPGADTLGLKLAADSAARVESVLPGSSAAAAGVQAGDELLSLSGQPLISAADVSWVLHRAPESGALAAVVRRGGAEQSLNLALPAGWRTKTDLARRVGVWGMRGMATGGLVLEDLADEERTRRGLGAEGMALWVKFVGQYNKHAAGKNAGFQKDDVIVELDGQTGRVSEGEMLARLLQKRFPGEKVKALVLRGKERVTLQLPMQ
ncbi:peptidase [Verrucomicrobiota bacterium]|nr:peptidase [Verrucomicrobiota bacterium]